MLIQACGRPTWNLRKGHSPLSTTYELVAVRRSMRQQHLWPNRIGEDLRQSRSSAVTRLKTAESGCVENSTRQVFPPEHDQNA
jgi:hypothetical protein